jgi:hypothetical protein
MNPFCTYVNSVRIAGTVDTFVMYWDCMKFYNESGYNILGIYTQTYVQVVQFHYVMHIYVIVYSLFCIVIFMYIYMSICIVCSSVRTTANG